MGKELSYVKNKGKHTNIDRQEKEEEEKRGGLQGWRSMCAFTWHPRPSAAPRCGFPPRSDRDSAQSGRKTQERRGRAAYSGGRAVPPARPRPLSAPPPIAARPAPRPRAAPSHRLQPQSGPAPRGAPRRTAPRPATSAAAGGCCPTARAACGGAELSVVRRSCRER